MSEPIDVFPNGQVPINVTPAQLVPIIINQGGSDPELEQKVAENTAKIAQHDQEITNINTQVTLLSNELAEQEQEIIDINADVVTNTQQITAINMELVDINTQLSSQETQIATNTQDITAIKTDISVIETVLEQHTIRMSDIETDVSALDTDVDNLSTQVAINTQEITDVNAELDSVSLQVTTNTQEITDINTELDSVSTQVTTNTQALVDVNTEVDNLGTQLSNKVNKTGDTMTGALELPFMVLNGGSSVARLFAGNIQDHVFVEFFADSQAQEVRSGYLGYGTPGSPTFTLHNQMNNGDLDFRTTGNGKLYHNGSSIWTDLNSLASLGGNGWQRLNSGLIIQWGKSAVIAPNIITQVVFPMAYINNGSSITIATVESTTASTVSVLNTTKTSFDIIHNDAISRAIRWISIGY